MNGGIANNCTVTGNSAGENGGGMRYGTANNCTIAGNTASLSGGGMYYGRANNCIVWGNMADSSDNDLSDVTSSVTCSPDAPHGANGCITNAPLFVDEVVRNYRLLSTSPCINAGYNGFVSVMTDLDGNPRIANGTVDMGAYEYRDEDGDDLPDRWEEAYFGAAGCDPDGHGDSDPYTNLEEYIAGTNPTHPASFFRIRDQGGTPADGFAVQWSPSVAGRHYSIWRAATMTNAFEELETRDGGPQDSYTNTAHASESEGFYKVTVELQ